MQKSVELDQANWLRMKNYTWIARENLHVTDTHGNEKATNPRLGRLWFFTANHTAR